MSSIAGDNLQASEAKPDCAIHQQACTKVLAGRTVELDIQPKPVKAMQDLLFTVTISGEAPAELPYIELSMPGMKMGPNQVRLVKVGGHAYEGKGVIVRCPSGKRIWQATVSLPGIGRVGFVFDVVY